MIRLTLPSFLFLLSGTAAAQLTSDQKLADFQQLAALLAKNYAPYEWKIQVENFDLYELKPWLDQVRASKSDLEFLDICTRYVGSLNDGHANFNFDTDFIARLGFGVDQYDGKILIDSINRTLLPASAYPLAVGDELVSVDGKAVADWIRELTPYLASGNPLSNKRFAAILITTRPQSFIPRAPEIGDTAHVVVRRQDDTTQSYTMKWNKTGTPVVQVGPVPSPRLEAAAAKRLSEANSAPEEATDSEDAPVGRLTPLVKIPGVSLLAPKKWQTVLNYSALNPVWALPQGFNMRLGRNPSDDFLSGTFTSEGWRIGYIRIPSFDPLDPNTALVQFLNEVQYMERNTDGLVVDVMRNPGGVPCYTDLLASLMIPYQHRAIGFELRATNWLVQGFLASLEELKAEGAEEWQIRYYESIVKDLQQAYSENRGRTGPLPICGISLDLQPLTDRSGRSLAYSKPLLVLIDETSASGAEVFAAQIQDAGRAVVFGMRTSGLGGITTAWDLTTYSEGTGRITFGLMNRKQPVVAEGYPTAPYIENIGVHPDIVVDYMTRENLLDAGRPFVRRFTEEMVKHIRNSQ